MKAIGIIGGGAAGMMAAITAAGNVQQAEMHRPVKVILFEQKEILGKKILSTGNGRCNLTNRKMDASFFRSDDPEVLQSVLDAFGCEDTIHFFENLGLMMKSRNGYIYPRCDQAAAVRGILDAECRRLGVEIHTSTRVERIEKIKSGFRIQTDHGSETVDRLILTTGGKASKALGSDGSGYEFAASVGHTIVPVVPALVQLEVNRHPFAKASGVRTDGKVLAFCDGKLMGEDTGEIQITEYGISGIPVFQISRFLAKAIYEHRESRVLLDFLPEKTEEEFLSYLLRRKVGRETQKMTDFLKGIFHAKLTPELLKLAKIREQTRVGQLDEEQLRRFVSCCKHTELEITKTRGFEQAQVCAGGVSLEEIRFSSMESSIVPNLFFAGELLDVDGICGGYNLQWAWTSGYLAGMYAAEGEKHDSN